MSKSLLRFCLCQALFIFYAFSCQADLATDTVYLTWQKNPSTTMTIQWITPPNQQQTIIFYCPQKSSGRWLEAKGECFKFPQSSQFFIHRVEFDQSSS